MTGWIATDRGFASDDVKERNTEQGKFVIAVDCKGCGLRYRGKSYQSVEVAYLNALTASAACKCGGGR